MDIKNLGANKGRVERVGSKGSPRSAGKSGAAGKAAGTSAAASSAANQGESLELTALARALSAAQADAATAPFDADRVQEIRDAIAEGRYPIDNRRLADKLIELEGLLD
jgi:negative regulator of flagellin synthesis FlgM